jgi:hypothetical protein
LALGLIVLAQRVRAAESPCGRFFRDFFDRAGIAEAKGLTSNTLQALGEQVRAHPERCSPGDYAIFANRYADLLYLITQNGIDDNERELSALARSLAPRRVAPINYEAAFHAFLDTRLRLSSHLPADGAAEILSLYDSIRPLEVPPATALGNDRDEVLAGLTEVRRLLALGQLSSADARAEEMIRALQAPLPPPDGGSTSVDPTAPTAPSAPSSPSAPTAATAPISASSDGGANEAPAPTLSGAGSAPRSQR